jgi:hypothetical protein
MTTKMYRIESTYHCGDYGLLVLPDGRTWADIEWWYVKWGTIFYKLRGDPQEYELLLHCTGEVDWKRPVETQVYELNENEEPVSDNPIAEA